MVNVSIVGLFFAVVFSSFVIAVSGQTGTPITASAVKPHIVELADDRLEGRGAGYKGERMAAEYIAREFKRIGLKPVGGRGYFQDFKFHPYHPTKPWQMMTSRNVLGLLEGSDPILKKEIVVVGAHYDGQGQTEQADPTRQMPPAGAVGDEIWNSANDNATSIAAIIEIARSLKTTPAKRSILFAAFGAEEHGMTGAIHYVNHPVFPIAEHVAMINLEKLGRSPEKPFTVAGITSSKAWAEIVASAGKSTGVKVASNPVAFPDSDHYPFGARGVPALMVSVSSNLDAHLPTDHADKIDFERVAEGARYAMTVVKATADRPEKLELVRSPMLDPGMIAHLATGAEADAAGLEPGQGGLKVTGVITGLPADKAGLREGDFVIAMNDRPFARDVPLAILMGEFLGLLQGKMGVNIPVKLLRNKQTASVILNLRN
jgi:hypothetical protein